MNREYNRQNASDMFAQAFDHGIRTAAVEGIAEPEYAVVFEIQCRTVGHSGMDLICGGQYHYDRNGILRKLYRHNQDFAYPMERLDIRTDCYFYDARGRVIRALEHGTYGTSADVFADFLRYTYQYAPDTDDAVPVLGREEKIGFSEENLCFKPHIRKSTDTDLSDIENRPLNPLLSFWGVAGDFENLQIRQENLLHPALGFRADDPSDKPIYDYRIIKASPDQMEKLIRCLEERRKI